MGGAAEHLIDGSEKRTVCRLSFEFRVRIIIERGSNRSPLLSGCSHRFGRTDEQVPSAVLLNGGIIQNISPTTISGLDN